MNRIWKVLTRKKIIDPVSAEETRLNRVLNTFDLTALGVGSTLGVGVYVLAGQVAKDTAGPSVVLSFLIAAIASVFAGLCYAEFGARAPRAGSAYIYSYVCVGEFIAFIIGWNLILEYVIGSASVAKGLTLYLDTLLNNTLQDTFIHIAPIHVEYLAKYFDFLSFGISVLLAIALAFGMKESSIVNNIITSLNIGVILFVIIAGSLKANSQNWHISPNNTNSTEHIGEGGFFPFGIKGMIEGAATCFYGFIGFDVIATTGEEVKNPRKAIPIAIILSLFIIFLAYFGTSTVLTLMVPYYLQDYAAPIPKAFESIGWVWAKWIIAVGAIMGLCASLFGAMFPLPRIIYAMGSDGLMFRFLAKVHSRFQTPVIGTVIAGILTGLMSALFDLKQLVNMMSIGTLLAYTIVAASVLILRYKDEVKKLYIPVKVNSSDTDSTSSESSEGEKYNDETTNRNFYGTNVDDNHELINSEPTPSSWKFILYIFNCRSREPNRITESIVAIEVFLYCIFCVLIGLSAIYLKTPLLNKETWALVLVSIVVGLTVLIIISMATQPRSRKELSFKVPFVPFVPAISILINIYLMLMLDYRTWIRFAVWMILGIPMYCSCAFKRDMKHEKRNYSTNILNGTTVIQNGTNPNKQSNFITIAEKKTKRPAPLPPSPPTPAPKSSVSATPLSDPIESIDNNNNSNNVEKLEEAVIAQLDHILDEEFVSIDEIDSGVSKCSLNSNNDNDNDSLSDVQLTNEVDVVLSNVVDSSLVSFENVSDNVSKETEENDMKIIENQQENSESPSNEIKAVSAAVPTAEALKTVRLRHIDTINIAIETEPEKNQLASNSNLKVGTEEYKKFRELLNARLKALKPIDRPHSITITTHPVPEQKIKTVTLNGEVDRESLDLSQAKQMLGDLLRQRTNRSNSMNTSRTISNSSQRRKYSKSVRQKNHFRVDHEKKMEDVFKSIELLSTKRNLNINHKAD